MITRLLSFFPTSHLAAEFLTDLEKITDAFSPENLKDPKLRDDLIQDTIEYLQSLKINKEKNGGKK